MQIRFDLSEKLYNSINKNCEDGKRAEFIRQAIEEKLSRKKKEQQEFNSLMDKMEKLDPLDVQTNLRDLLLTTQIIFEEMKKQNEVLKLVHRRSGFAGTCSVELWEVGKSSQDKQLLIKTLNAEYAKEIKSIQL